MPESQPANKTYFGVQALRAFAALLVVVFHAVGLWNDRVSLGRFPYVDWSNTQTGVDIFFVISGFVMAVTVPGLVNERHKARVFLWRRFVRIVPLYWFFTTIKVARLSFAPPNAREGLSGWWQIVASYLFIHSPHDGTKPIPLLTVGWTLNYEVVVYYRCAVALALELAPIWLLAPVLSVVAVVGWFERNSPILAGSPVSPMVLEFLFGVIIAQLTLRRRLPGRLVGWLLLAIGCAGILTLSGEQLGTRAFSWGLPAAAIVLGTVILEDTLGKNCPRWLLELGNASYALYLSHTFVISIVWVTLLRLNLRGQGSLWLMVGGALLLSSLTGELVHRLIELPILKALRGKRVRGVSTLPVEPVAGDGRA